MQPEDGHGTRAGIICVRSRPAGARSAFGFLVQREIENFGIQVSCVYDDRIALQEDVVVF
jgi:hypothetical protein